MVLQAYDHAPAVATLTLAKPNMAERQARTSSAAAPSPQEADPSTPASTSAAQARIAREARASKAARAAQARADELAPAPAPKPAATARAATGGTTPASSSVSSALRGAVAAAQRVAAVASRARGRGTAVPVADATTPQQAAGAALASAAAGPGHASDFNVTATEAVAMRAMLRAAAITAHEERAASERLSAALAGSYECSRVYRQQTPAGRTGFAALAARLHVRWRPPRARAWREDEAAALPPPLAGALLTALASDSSMTATERATAFQPLTLARVNLSLFWAAAQAGARAGGSVEDGLRALAPSLDWDALLTRSRKRSRKAREADQ